MKTAKRLVKPGILLLITGIMFIALSVSEAFTQEYKWYKGQTHVHTTNSDGDSPPREVTDWYKEHGYNFLVITDHNYVTQPLYYDVDPDDEFILIRGEEVSDGYNDTPVHLNGINIRYYVRPQGGGSIVETLQRNTDAIKDAGGIAQINHPNWRWSFGADELKAVEGAALFELWNVTKTSNNFGGGGHPGMEEIWDNILSSGKIIYGVFVDDMHSMKGEFSWEFANPGRGWVVVKANALTPDAITNALSQGLFYSSTGVTLLDYYAYEEYMAITLQEEENKGYTVSFIGKGGEILKETEENPAIYNFTRGEMYVRAKIVSSDGETAFTQPYFSPYYHK